MQIPAMIDLAMDSAPRRAEFLLPGAHGTWPGTSPISLLRSRADFYGTRRAQSVGSAETSPASAFTRHDPWSMPIGDAGRLLVGRCAPTFVALSGNSIRPLPTRSMRTARVRPANVHYHPKGRSRPTPNPYRRESAQTSFARLWEGSGGGASRNSGGGAAPVSSARW